MPSKNEIKICHIEVVAKCMEQLLAAGMTENLAIRHLEKLVDVYAKHKIIGKVTVDHVDEFALWSVAALAVKKQNSHKKAGEHLRVEHGTPRRKFALLVLHAHREGKLNKRWLDRHCDKLWKVAVVTHEEDRRLGKMRKLDFRTPADRWSAAGIVFPKSKSL